MFDYYYYCIIILLFIISLFIILLFVIVCSSSALYTHTWMLMSTCLCCSSDWLYGVLWVCSHSRCEMSQNQLWHHFLPPLRPADTHWVQAQEWTRHSALMSSNVSRLNGAISRLMRPRSDPEQTAAATWRDNTSLTLGRVKYSPRGCNLLAGSWSAAGDQLS